ncbi:hypothetical protein CCHR01_11690 [Colletotrichum chrysophilum]|uniref:Uncharacterized protein n=1 Tax=Colletotrichum chrysophilum TaxID=1836956 RepID=A0AAD9ADB6_9PEZI|nr:hypothetical protein CCHR01_11690 [Colletotrichum chrysophilum]
MIHQYVQFMKSIAETYKMPGTTFKGCVSVPGGRGLDGKRWANYFCLTRLAIGRLQC